MTILKSVHWEAIQMTRLDLVTVMQTVMTRCISEILSDLDRDLAEMHGCHVVLPLGSTSAPVLQSL